MQQDANIKGDAIVFLVWPTTPQGGNSGQPNLPQGAVAL
jgi:hypothetical protein